MPDTPDQKPDVEDWLRQSAPALPATLKQRTLANCTAHVAAKQQRRNRLHRQLSWGVAGVFVLQSLILFAVDAQNTRLLVGNSAPPPIAAFTLAEVSELWHQRSRQLAQLLELPKWG